ncbi:hypothetical protein SBADM41S_09918 [Streptomyces badius]
MGRSASAHDFLQRVAEGTGRVGGQLDNQPTAAFARNAQDDARPLLGTSNRASPVRGPMAGILGPQ